MLPRPVPKRPPVQGLTLLLLFSLSLLYDLAALWLAAWVAKDTYHESGGGGAVNAAFVVMGYALTCQLLLASAFAINGRPTYAVAVGAVGFLLGICAAVMLLLGL